MASRLSIQNEVEVQPDQITFNGGSSLSLGNVCAALIEAGDVIVTEDPSYPGTLHHYRLADAEVVGVEVDREGMRAELLADTLERLEREGKRVKIIHTIPDFQNPTGNTISLRRRREILALAAQHRAVVVEDIAYRELHFDEPPPPSFYTLAGGNGVVQLGTFAKTWATGLRVGWALAAPDLARAIAATHSEAGISAILTRAMRRIIEDGRLDRRILEQREALRIRRDAAIAGLQRYAGESIRFEVPEGGYFLWLRLPPGADPRQCVLNAIEEGAMLLPGAPFFVDNEDRPFMRMAYSYLSPADLDEAMRRIARGVDRALEVRS